MRNELPTINSVRGDKNDWNLYFHLLILQKKNQLQVENIYVKLKTNGKNTVNLLYSVEHVIFSLWRVVLLSYSQKLILTLRYDFPYHYHEWHQLFSRLVPGTWPRNIKVTFVVSKIHLSFSIRYKLQMICNC